jgi:hypothetical protein
MAGTFADRLNAALDADCSPGTPMEPPWPPLRGIVPVNRADRLLSLLHIYDLHTAPLQRLGRRARWAGHPAIVAVKCQLEQEWLAELEDASRALRAGTDPIKAIRSLAAKDRLPPVYRWVAKEASLNELRRFLSIEGGPDGGFDDLVALCQVGLSGAPKMEMARNYWDEMGNGTRADVHRDLHRRMAVALELPELQRESLPEPALARAALAGLLASNRWLQPEMVGALGLIELQAGPRCRLVLDAFRRLGVSRDAELFYAVHADVDPRHGKEWLEQVVAPLGAQSPDWAGRMIRGAAWRWVVNAELFDALGVSQSHSAAG